MSPEGCGSFPLACAAPAEMPARSACGCGCVPAPPGLCAMPAEAYLITDPLACAEKEFLGCPPNSVPFLDFCGCGCAPLDPAGECPKVDDPAVDYLDETVANVSLCSVLSFKCEPGQVPFSIPNCGCGCVTSDGPTIPLPEPTPTPTPPPP
ncbi:MAG TPA: hypothetical protein VFS00_09045 [Polyangiaceae bacterium]|nr:hypothetical protein [Polyangiaceae bacterium]